MILSFVSLAMGGDLIYAKCRWLSTETPKNSGHFAVFCGRIARSPRIFAELNRSLAVNFRQKQRSS
jgi:hypothetical protein